MDTDPEAELLPPLWQWCKSHARYIPPPMFKASTFYEAARASRLTQWRRELDKFMALHAWATISLIGDSRTRPYMAKLIHDEESGFHWIKDCGRGTIAAMEALSRDTTRDRKRAFEQHRTAAIKALASAREHLEAMRCDLPLLDLMEGADVRHLKRAMEAFNKAAWDRRTSHMRSVRERTIRSGGSSHDAFVAAMTDMLKSRGDDIPHFGRLLLEAEKRVQKVSPPITERHAARGLYLRGLFQGLSYSAISTRRVAFLTHACAAVFAEIVEKRSVRRLVADIAARERRQKRLNELTDLLESGGVTYDAASEELHELLAADAAED